MRVLYQSGSRVFIIAFNLLTGNSSLAALSSTAEARQVTDPYKIPLACAHAKSLADIFTQQIDQDEDG
jgi:hypothetical protein